MIGTAMGVYAAAPVRIQRASLVMTARPVVPAAANPAAAHAAWAGQARKRRPAAATVAFVNRGSH